MGELFKVIVFLCGIDGMFGVFVCGDCLYVF